MEAVADDVRRVRRRVETVALMTDRRSLLAALTRAAHGIVTAMGPRPSVGVLVGELGGPPIAMALPDRAAGPGATGVTTPSGTGA